VAPVTSYDRLAEIAGEYVKGRPIYVEGRLQMDIYPSGVEKNTVDIVATELQPPGAREGMGARKTAKTHQRLCGVQALRQRGPVGSTCGASGGASASGQRL